VTPDRIAVHVSAGVTWSATMDLRWVHPSDGHEVRLEQKWESDRGGVEWRPIAVVAGA